MRYKLTPEARSDLKQVAEYIAVEASAERSIQVITELRDEFRKLGGMPGMGHFCEELLGKDYKFWSCYSYIIAYRWKTKPVQIIAIVHGARDLDAFFSKRLK